MQSLIKLKAWYFLILTTISVLVINKYKLKGSHAPNIFAQKFYKYGFVSEEIFNVGNVREMFNEIFTPKYFIALMIHLCLMAPIEGGYYLMPAILDPLAYDKVLEHCKKYNDVEPLLLCFTTTKFVPYGIFTNLVAFIIKHKYGELDLDEHKVPTCLYRNCVKRHPGKFKIVDSFSCIQIYLQSSKPDSVCPDLKDTVLNGIKECAKALNYEDITIKEGFICHNCRQVKCQFNLCFPYEKDPNTTHCDVCLTDITICNTTWQLG